MKLNKLFKAIIVIGILLRIYQFGSLPLSLNRDEAALGYNAWAISTAGIDEWGSKHPVMFKSFGDYKLPGYIYSLSAFIKVFGVSEVVVRLPSLLAGISTIFLVYFLARKASYSKNSSLFIAAAISVSPWAIFYSRVGFEANLGLSLFLLSMILIPSKKICQSILGLFTYIFSILTYNTPLMIFPLLIIWIFINSPKKLKIKSYVFSTLIVIISLLWMLAIRPLITQKSGITVFSDPYITNLQASQYSQSDTFIKKIINHKFTYPLGIIAKNTINTLTPKFLVISGGENPWHSLPATGHIYWVTYVLFVISVFGIRKKSSGTKKIFLPSLLVLFGLVPAIITSDAPHATRSLIVFVGITFFSAIYWEKMKKISKNLIILILLLETSLYAYKYFVLFPQNHSFMWHVGLKEAIVEANQKYPDETINITVPENQPYIYTLLYDQTNPQVYTQSVEYYGPDSAGIEYVKSYSGWSFIGDIKDTPEDTPIIHQNESGKYLLLSDKYQTYEK